MRLSGSCGQKKWMGFWLLAFGFWLLAFGFWLFGAQPPSAVAVAHSLRPTNSCGSNQTRPGHCMSIFFVILSLCHPERSASSIFLITTMMGAKSKDPGAASLCDAAAGSSHNGVGAASCAQSNLTGTQEWVNQRLAVMRDWSGHAISLKAITNPIGQMSHFVIDSPSTMR